MDSVETSLTMAMDHITARIDALETQLRRERLRLAFALKQAEAGAWEWDPVGDKLWWSPQMFELYGIDANNFGGKYKDFEKLLDPAEVQRIRDAVTDANSKRAIFRHVFRLRNGRSILGIGRVELHNGVMYGINVDVTTEHDLYCHDPTNHRPQ